MMQPLPRSKTQNNESRTQAFVSRDPDVAKKHSWGAARALADDVRGTSGRTAAKDNAGTGASPAALESRMQREKVLSEGHCPLPRRTPPPGAATWPGTGAGGPRLRA